MKKILICFMLLCSILLLVNCKKQIAYSFKIIGENEVEEECSIFLAADKTFDETIKWSSSDESIAVVEDGIVYDDGTMRYLEALAQINIKLAEIADRVIEVVVGIPVELKTVLKVSLED